MQVEPVVTKIHPALFLITLGHRKFTARRRRIPACGTPLVWSLTEVTNPNQPGYLEHPPFRSQKKALQWLAALAPPTATVTQLEPESWEVAAERERQRNAVLNARPRREDDEGNWMA